MPNTLAVTCPTHTLISVSCAAPVVVGHQAVVQLSQSSNYSLIWKCTITNQDPRLDISLVWSVNKAFEIDFPPPRGVRSLLIMSRDGALVGSAPVKGVANGVPMTVKVEVDAVQVQDRLEFDILLSTCVSTAHTLKNASAEHKLARLKCVTASLMYDIDTMNMAFTFGYNGSTRNVALWTHQSVLGLHPSFHSLISKLSIVQGDPSSPEAVSGVKTIHVTKYTLECYCALIRYLYSNTIDLHVDLDDFPLGQPPTNPFSPSSKTRLTVDGPLWSTVPASTRPPSDTITHHNDHHHHHHLTTTWEELFQLSDLYQLTELREHCLIQIVDALNSSTVLDVLFRYAFRYSDLKERVLQFVAGCMKDLYARSKDPFAAYAEHPERHELMAEALHLMFEAKSHIAHVRSASRASRGSVFIP